MIIDLGNPYTWLALGVGAIGTWKTLKEAKKVYDTTREDAGRKALKDENRDADIEECKTDRKGPGGLHDRISTIEGEMKKRR